MDPAVQRVKVYKLNDEGTWHVRGTGHVNVAYYDVSGGGKGRDEPIQSVPLPFFLLLIYCILLRCSTASS